MPLYEFFCAECGPFEQRRAMSQASEPADCPSCAEPAPRLISAPNLRRTTPLQRMMLGRNEAGAEPRVSRSPTGAEPGAPAEPHTHNHKHHPHRPWMLGH